MSLIKKQTTAKVHIKSTSDAQDAVGLVHLLIEKVNTDLDHLKDPVLVKDRIEKR